jgi:hypothetical protein
MTVREKVWAEREELRLRIQKLHDFRNTSTYGSLSLLEQEVLSLQMSAMTVYLGVLNLRLKHFTNG